MPRQRHELRWYPLRPPKVAPFYPAPNTGIDYSEIPALTDEQLAQFKRAPKVLVAARIDKDVYDWLMKYGKGYSTRINGILRTVMERTC